MADVVCVSLQSLQITKVIGSTSWIPSVDEDDCSPDPDTADLMFPIYSTPEFGFTIGAPASVLACISRINLFNKKQRDPLHHQETDHVMEEILSTLNASLQDETEFFVCGPDNISQKDAGWESRVGSAGRRFQRTAFVYATYIYLYRTVLNVSPRVVRSYVSSTFQNVSTFYGMGDRTANFSIWPAFIAAVEAYTEEDLTKAREWLDWTTSFGLGSRSLVRKVVEEVWRKREEKTLLYGISPGEVNVDWRETMYELDCDVLLV